MSGSRLSSGGLIDRSTPVSFQWLGRTLDGYRGDTLASALLANGVGIVGRSFKLHRPRGIYGSGTEEPNAIIDLSWGERHDPSARATLVDLLPGMQARGVNAWPSVEHDLFGLLDRAHRFLPAGFYYKTFIAPRWHTYESTVRRLAGIGRAREIADPLAYETRHAHCDILIIGGGPAGLAAARAAAAGGLKIILADERTHWGGSLLWHDGEIEDRPAHEWIAATVTALEAAGTVQLMPRTTAFGYYDHNSVGLIERRATAPDGWAEERLWHVHAKRVILATGAIERPLVFPDNDRPGVMSAAAVLHYIRQYAVLPGRNAVIVTNNDSAYETAVALHSAGAAVTVADLRDSMGGAAKRAADHGIKVMTGTAVLGVSGSRGVKGVALGPPDATSLQQATLKLDADLIAISGGWSPAVHLFSQSGGKLRYDAACAAFVPIAPREAQHLGGAVTGSGDLTSALDGGHRAGIEAAAALGRSVATTAPHTTSAPAETPIGAHWRIPIPEARQWVDFQNDVTVNDIALAARENYASVEHLKRYTTLGMAHDQGKTSNINGLALLAEFTGRPIESTGTTTFRPPYVPVSIGALVGLKHGPLYSPKRILPLHATHASLGASFCDYGGWMRPACYPKTGESIADAVAREALAARNQAGLFDGSSLGKIEIFGPDAAAFLNLIYYNEVANLRPGHLRYCLLLQETGIVYDDGVVARLASDRYLLSPSSSHTTGVLSILELWHQTEYPQLRVWFHDVTNAWATFAVSGPRSRDIVERLSTDIDVSDAALPHMTLARGMIEGVPGRIARVSFTGERSYEISVSTGYAAALWQRLRDIGARYGITPFGVETLSTLRAEKGYILIGVDSDGMTLPGDLGMKGPETKKVVDFIGRRSLFTPEARRPDRRQLIGLRASSVLPVGAHAFERQGNDARSTGWVTTSVMSPTVGRPIALAMIESGRERVGQKIEIFDQGRIMEATVVAPCFYDPAGERLRG
ncbi:MAG TPA: sarcosine oxidase subunit alpha family protein [Magnetospirillaceae bacterium]|jgi:sarcosine oxidase subunit alpha